MGDRNILLPATPRTPMYSGDVMNPEWQDFFRDLYLRVKYRPIAINGVYTTIVDVNPATELGYGTWVKIADDTVGIVDVYYWKRTV